MTYLDLEKNVFGRDEILSLLKKRVIDLKDGYRQNIALIGDQYVGKSTVLHHFVSDIQDEDVTIIYLDLENKDFGYFCSKFIGSLLYNYSKNNELPLHDDVTLLIESTRQRIPQTIQIIEKIQENYKRNKLNNAFLGLMTLPEVFTNETSSCCVLIFDEFQHLEDLSIPDIYQELGNKIMTQKKCLYVLSSSFDYLAKKILSEKLTLLFGSFEDVMVEPFNPENSQEFIEINLLPIKINSQLRNFLTDFTGGHPLYLNLICRELKNLCAVHQQNEVYMPILSLAVENTIFDRWGVLSRHFELINNELSQGKGNQINAMILMELSNGCSKSEDLLDRIDIKKTPLNQRLARLVELGILMKNGGGYFFKDKLFRYWMRFIYQKRIKDVELAPDKQKQLFKEEFSQCLENFKLCSRQEFSTRIIDLLHCIDNSSVELKGKRYRMPAFREITQSRLKNDSGVYFDLIQAKANNELWFIVMKKDIISENDVYTILNETKKFKKKPKRCLIVSLMDMEENAKLKALQERFWIWNQGDLNMLSSLFDKPYILR